jgi:UDP-N-acetylglucosamine transferase subunit ALG13
MPTNTWSNDLAKCREYDMVMHGPAMTLRNELILQFGRYTVDLVVSYRCFEWPRQAADWTKRHRHYNWPDASTIESIVKNGCDVVAVAHRQYKQDEWMSEHQYRLSFSRAETVLLNSWAPIQQIVYHILRFVLSKSGLTEVRDDTGDKMLSRYHLKTLMLWTSEIKHSDWWHTFRRCSVN